MNDRYWSKRGKLSYIYRGEKFYTITPLPFYLRRRKILLNKLDKVIRGLKKNKSKLSICDFGSGDGFYCCWLGKKLPESEITGFDVSPSMTREAQERVAQEKVSNVSIYCENFNNEDNSYDLVLSFAVLQHFVKEKEIAKKAKQIHDHLGSGGMLVLFEATSKHPTSKQNLLSRTEDFYEGIFESAGFKMMEKQFISFPLFNIYQRKFLGLLKKIFNGGPVHQSIAMNKSFVMNGLNRFILRLSCLLDKLIQPKEGNTVFVFKKE